VVVNGEAIGAHNPDVFSKEGSAIHVKAGSDAQPLYLSAGPIDEPVAAKDNFVKNTDAEVDQAIADYKNGLFGELSY